MKIRSYSVIYRLGYSHSLFLKNVEAENAKQAFEIACRVRLPELGLKRFGKLRAFYVTRVNAPEKDNYGYSCDKYDYGWLLNVGSPHKEELLLAIESIKENQTQKETLGGDI